MSLSYKDCQKLIKTLPEALFLEDFEGNILEVNEEACRMLGYREEELLDLEVEDLVPEDAPAFLPGQIDKATRSGQPLETTNIRKDGTEVPVELKGKIIEVEGQEKILVTIRDISERKKAEEELHFESSLMESLMEHVPDLIYFKDREARFIRVSRSKAEEVGEDCREDLHGKTDLDYYSGEQAREVFQDDMKVIQDEEPISQKEERYFQDGKTYWLEATKVPRYDEDGNVVGLLGISRDVTARKSTERELRETKERLRQSKERYQSYFEELGDAVFIIGVDQEDYGKILDVNSAAEDQTGYTREELIGMNLPENIASGEPLEMAYEEANQKLSRGETISFTQKKRRKDGTDYWTEVVVTPIEHEGERANLSINRDVSERIRVKDQLEQYKMAVQGSDDLIAACDEDYNYIFANPAYRSFYNIKEEEIRNYKLADVNSDSAFESEIKPRVDRCLQGERIEYEMERTHPKKGARQLRITYYPLKGEEKIYGAVAIMRDITERKKAERALNKERDKLKSLHEAVDILQQQNNEEDLLQTAVGVAEKMLDFQLCAISLVEGDYLVTKAISSGLSPGETTKYKIGEGLTGKTFQTGETIWGDDLRKSPEAKPIDKSFRSYISTPIADLGTFQVVSEEVGSFTQQDVELAEILVGHIKEELERVRLEEELRQQAIHDPLTGLYNRRHFNVTLGKEVKRCERYGHSIAFIMIDVNRFKEINDRYSHHTGDKVLQEVADLLQANVRDADTAVRYGGDEFLIMMPETNGEANNTIERLRRKLAEWNEESDLLDFPLSLAMGLSHWSSDQDRDVEEALKEADQKMYEEKGR